MELYTLIVAGHVIGTILGAGGATVAEIQINTALKKGDISEDERALMHANYTMIRVGMAIILASVIAMFWYHLSQGNTWIITSEKLWIKDIMFVMIFVNAGLLTKHWIPLWLGASISFTSWWGATLLGLAGRLPYNFFTYLFGYIVAIFVVAYVLHLIRLRMKQPVSKKT